MRSTIAKVSLSNLSHNVQTVKKIASASSILAVVKANSYGHGIVSISLKMRQLGIDFLGVAYPEEGALIRDSGDTSAIVVIVPPPDDDAKLICDYRLQAATSSIEFLKALNFFSKRAKIISKVHLFINTGMNRDGIFPEDALYFLSVTKDLENVKIVGICTHFAKTTQNLDFAKIQLKRFKDLLTKLKERNYNFQYIHTANSGAIANLPESHFNLVRPGMALYGLPPAKDIKVYEDLKPMLELHTRVASVRDIKKGDTVGYDLEYISDADRKVVTIPIGYGDGFFKPLSNKAECLINGKRYGIVGSICMDECMVNVENDDIRVDDEVVLIGKQGKEEITCFDLAEKVGTIHYEVLTSLSHRVPRVYSDNGFE